MIPELETERLILRAPQDSDMPLYQKYFNNWEVIRHLSARVPWPYPDDGVKIFFRDLITPNQGKSVYLWGMFLKNSNELIGAVQLNTKAQGTENRGFWLAEQYWGNGYMTEACIEVNRFAFEVIKLKRMIFCNAVQNDRSSRVKEKTGAKLLRIEPFSFVDPELTEHKVWELTYEDWLQLKNSDN